MRCFSQRLCLLSLLGVSFGCIGVSERRVNPDGTPAPPRYCPTGDRVAPTGLIDNMEDGNTRIAEVAGRGGYWWKSADNQGSDIGPEDFAAQAAPEGGGVIHVSGHTAEGNGADNWGAQFGASFLAEGTYDASAYVGVRFRARVDAGTHAVRFKLADANTHPKFGICTNCWNHFGVDVTLNEAWTEYQYFFASLTQAPGWGSPRPASITPSKLYGLEFSITPGQKFDIWVDDIAFISCR